MMNKDANRMRLVRIYVFVAVLVCAIALSAVGVVHAQDLEISNPSMVWDGWEGSYDFGDVALGESRTATFRFESIAMSSARVIIYLLWLTSANTSPYDIANPDDPTNPTNCLGSFCFDPATHPGFPHIMPVGDFFTVDVIFTPLSLGEQNVYLYSFSDDRYPPPGTVSFISLKGTGVSGPTPEEQIEDIQEFFDSSVASGALVGVGATQTAAAGKLHALKKMLAQAEYLIDSGDTQGACTQLHDAYEKTDGLTRPPDFVAGSATEELAAMIQDVMESLGCE